MKENESKAIVSMENIEGVIYIIRGYKVILDQDLAALYEVETKQFNRAIKRNKSRFPEDFAFQLTKEEWNSLRCQFGTSNENSLRSQIVTSKTGRGGRRYLPFVFTEHGALMAANILKSKRAITVSIEITRTFIKLRNFLSSQKEVVKDLSEIKSYILKRFNKADREFRRVWNAIEKLTNSPKNDKRQIGFDLN